MASYVNLGNNKYELRVSKGYDARGKQIRKTKNVTVKTVKALKLELSNFEAYVYSSDYTEIKDMRFIDFVEKWRLNYAKRELKGNTIDKYNLFLENWIIPYFERKKISKITTMQLLDYFHEVQKKGVGPSALEGHHRVIRSLFKYATLWGITETDVSLSVKKPTYKVPEKNIYNRREIEVLIDRIKILQKYQQVMIKLALYCGLRRGEVIGLTTKDMNYNKNTINVYRAVIKSASEGIKLDETKNKRKRIVPAPAGLMQEIKELAKEKQKNKDKLGLLWKGTKDLDGKTVVLIFSHDDGTPFTPASVTRMFNRFLEKEENNDLTKISFHDLRHSAASFLLEQGINVKVIQNILGHSDIKVTLNTYAHITEDGYSEAAKTFDNFYKSSK
ncbi:TPA: site-specific integrase [Listeria monocytogenes]|uniref:Site-specific integrase n=6 Tax=Listeria monocytogenes TaxID=1639 RepID=A0A393HZ01_LISMN|nr:MULTISPECIES: tyrosine-type recombinase/integrase [Listeria]EAF3060827.1 site-specific integrase [Listeria monocytogenes serotype 1/2a]EAG6285047.1 site-specific integrase [Listeria monocytogenes CFSAN003810]EKE4577112.1 site-specific integrase [Listeria monocytogenes serotype 1/2b]MCY51534.1 site-specific integrase [Listeria monocytogenes serotype 4b]HCJ4529532.1 site-specific integrase [Listeria innocua]